MDKMYSNFNSKELNEFLSKETGKVDPNQRGGKKEGTNINKSVDNINFDIKPIELENYLKEYVINQDEAIEVIATKVSTHFNRMKLERNEGNDERIVGNIKSNVLMIGPTGVGKTYIIKLIAQKIGVPFVKGDATKFSETGYVGGDVEDLIRDLVREADGEISLAEYGIVYLDEIDKIAGYGNSHGPDVSRTGVQRNLLKLMEEAEVELKAPHDLASQMEAMMEAQRTGKVKRKKINTRNILFIMSGAFSGLDEIIKKRLNLHHIGFKNDFKKKKTEQDYLKFISTEDLIKYGFESEFIGRLPVITLLNDLNEESLYQILKNPKSSVILGKKMDFRAYGINIEFEDSSFKELSKLAFKEKTGARSLVSVCEKALLKFEKHLPSTKVKKIIINDEIVINPNKHIQELIFEDSMQTFIEDYTLENNVVLHFTDNVIKKIKSQSFKEGTTFYEIAEKILNGYEYGLKLIEVSDFTIDDEVFENPKEYLNNLIAKNYDKKNKETGGSINSEIKDE